VKTLVVSANLGGFDKDLDHEPQSMSCDYFNFTDKNFPLRDKSMTPRLQAKIPKCFAWQLKPGYDYYLWIDGNLRLSHPDSLKYFYDAIKGYDVVVLQHPTHDTIHWEYRYNHRGLHSNAPSNYLRERYTDEFLDEQYEVIKNDKDYKDDLLVNGGIFMYRNTPEVQKMLKEWWYHISRYLIMDQMSWAYVLKKSGLKINILPDVFNDCPWLENRRHKLHG
jgi:hypothetical protein